MAWNFLDSSGNSKQLIQSLDSTPIGSGVLWFTDTAPAGFLLCQGQSLAVANYPELFAVIGYTYGGSGANFSLPDMRGRGPMGKNAATFATLGAQGGAETHTLSTAELASHQHTQQGSFASGTESADHSHSGTASQNVTWSTIGNNTTGGAGNAVTGMDMNSTARNNTQVLNSGFTSGGRSAAHTHTTTISGLTVAAGSGSAHNNLQPYHVVHYAIRYTAAVPATTNGSITYNAPGTEVTNGFAELAADSNGAGDKLSITVVGDGVTAMLIQAEGLVKTTGVAGTQLYLQVRDGAGGTGTVYAAGYVHVPAAAYQCHLNFSRRVAPFTGSRTFYLHLNNGSGTPFIYGVSSQAPAHLRATWAG